jgi:hypothetical protein
MDCLFPWEQEFGEGCLGMLKFVRLWNLDWEVLVGILYHGLTDHPGSQGLSVWGVGEQRLVANTMLQRVATLFYRIFPPSPRYSMLEQSVNIQ